VTGQGNAAVLISSDCSDVSSANLINYTFELPFRSYSSLSWYLPYCGEK